MRFYLGLDVHHKTSTCCVLDAHGREVETFTVRGRWDRLLDRLRTLKGELIACYEASIGYGPLYEALGRVCRRVVVAHPGRLRLIFRSRRKNDRVDARKLAKLLYLDEVPAVHVPSLDGRSWRELIEFRRRLVDKRTRCKNGLRALLRGQAVAAPRSLWTKKGRAWLEALGPTLATAAARLRLEALLSELDHHEQQVRRVTEELDRMARDHPGVALLMTIPGVGPRTAEAVLAYVDAPRRFARTRRVGAYFGLVPCQDASASVNRLGHVTKEGPATVRKLLIESSWRAVAHCPALRACFDRITQGKPERRKIALVAVAHKLVRTMLAMLKSGECYRPAVA